jgi:hypothetical protein
VSYNQPVGRAHDRLEPPSNWGWARRSLHRLAHLHGGRLGQNIPPLDALEDEIDKRIASGENEEDVTLSVIEDFEKSAATVSARTTPLVPVSGVIVTGAGILTKQGEESEIGTALALLAMLITLLGLGFLASSVFTHAGRPSVGFEPTRADVAFVHDRLIRKEANARVGSLLAFAGFIVLLIVIL